MTDVLVLGAPAALALLAYLAAMIAIGVVAQRYNRAASGLDYFLGNKLTGVVMLFFTMQATQYSGNAFFGFTGMGYRSGLIWILAVPLVCLIITVQLSFAPRLYVLSKRYGYLTPADFYADRYASPVLRLVVATLTIVSMFPYLMIQAEATGHAFEGLTDGRLPFASGVAFISVVMFVYVVTGGWRAVVWTDAIQGVWLTAAIVITAVVALDEAGGIAATLGHVATETPEKFRAPTSWQALTSSWLSLLIVSGIGFAMYPQAMQRIYAAGSEQALKTSFSLMLLVPFIIGTATLVIGLSALVLFPGLKGIESDAVFSMLLERMLEKHYWLVVFILCGVLAAIMSTASSVVLTLASIFTNDLYVPLTRKPLDDAGLARVGRWFTFVILVLVVVASAEPTTSLWRLTEIKVEFLMQLFPPLILGLYWPRYTKAAALAGIVVGSLVVGVMMVADLGRWWLFQAGLWGLAANFAVGVGATLSASASNAERERVRRRFFALFG